MKNKYKILGLNQEFGNEKFRLVPIRFEDRFDIMKWRNEQIYHLRQNKPLNFEDQNRYFQNVIANLFNQDKPDQILFSFLQGNTCIGYGGLVHINWLDLNAEISFIMNSELEEINFEVLWINYLELIEQVAFKNLNLHKIYTYAFDLRPRLYIALEQVGFLEDARLKEHCFIQNDYLDVVIHSKWNVKS